MCASAIEKVQTEVYCILGPDHSNLKVKIRFREKKQKSIYLAAGRLGDEKLESASQAKNQPMFKPDSPADAMIAALAPLQHGAAGPARAGVTQCHRRSGDTGTAVTVQESR